MKHCAVATQGLGAGKLKSTFRDGTKMSDQGKAMQGARDHLRNLGKNLRTIGSVASMEIDGVSLNYWIAGSGPQTIVFLHGNSCAKEVFYKQFAHLATKDFTLIAIDLPGHGGSSDAPKPESQYTIPGYALIIERCLEALNVNDYIFVGWSLGGNIALEIAGNELVGNKSSMAAMLIMGAPPVGPGADNFEKAYLPATFETAATSDDAGDDEMTVFANSVYGELGEIPELFMEAALHTDARARETMMTHWVSGENGHDQLTTAANWDKPICIAHGQKEPFVSLNFLENTKWKNLWGDKVHLLNNGGHAPFVEDSMSFNALLDLFISDVSNH